MTPEIKNELQWAIGDTYQAVAPDVDMEFFEDGDWAEIVCDANRVETFADLSADALDVWRNLPWNEKLKFANSCNYW